MSATRKKAPPRPSAKKHEICDHCRKRCGNGIVRTKDGVFCSPKHRKARLDLMRAASTPPAKVLVPEIVDVGAAMSTALARRGIADATPAISFEQRDIFASWLEAKSPETVRCYRQWLHVFAEWLRKSNIAAPYNGDPDLDVDGNAILGLARLGAAKCNWHVQRWINAQVAAGIPRTTYAKHYAAVRSFCATMQRAGMVDFVPAATLPRSEPRSAFEVQQKYGGVPASYKMLAAALENLVDEHPGDALAIRDLAILKTGRGLGLRRMEIGRLNVSDVDFDLGSVRLLRKGRKRKIEKPLPKWLADVLRMWIAVRDLVAPGAGEPLFVVLHGDIGKRLELGSINAIMTRRAEQFGVELRPHDLRRIFCTRAIKLYGLNKAKALSDHKNVATLEIYDISQGEELVEMAESASQDDD